MKNENFGVIFFGIFVGYIGWSNVKYDDFKFIIVMISIFFFVLGGWWKRYCEKSLFMDCCLWFL